MQINENDTNVDGEDLDIIKVKLTGEEVAQEGELKRLLKRMDFEEAWNCTDFKLITKNVNVNCEEPRLRSQTKLRGTIFFILILPVSLALVHEMWG